MEPRSTARELSGRAAAASSRQRAWAASNRNGIRSEVVRRPRVRSGEASRSSWATTHSKKQETPPRRWLKLRGHALGRDARKSSRNADVSSSSRQTPPSSAKRWSSRSSDCSLWYLRPRALRWARNRSMTHARLSLIRAPPLRRRGRLRAAALQPPWRGSPSRPEHGGRRSFRSPSG